MNIQKKWFICCLSFFMTYLQASDNSDKIEQNYQAYVKHFKQCNYENSYVPQVHQALLTKNEYQELSRKLSTFDGHCKPNFGFGQLPDIAANQIRSASFNVKCDISDIYKIINDTEESSDTQSRPNYLNFDNRGSVIKALIDFVNPDILFFQEASYDQFQKIFNYLPNHKITAIPSNKNLVFGFSKTKTTDPFSGNRNLNYLGFMCGIAVKNTFDILENGFFNLNASPNLYMQRIDPDQPYRDEKYDSIKFHKIVVWARLKHKTLNQALFVATAQFHDEPGKHRHESAALCVQQLKFLAKGQPIIFGGDLNLFQDLDGVPAYKLLSSELQDWRNCPTHFGHPGTFVGYTSDKLKASVDETGPHQGSVDKETLDFMGYQGFNIVNSFSLLGEFDVETNNVFPFDQPIRDSQTRAFASDHTMIGNTLEFQNRLS